MTDPRLLTLNADDQLTLVGLMLRLMAADISQERDDDVADPADAASATSCAT